ncbi:hypothetical protein [Streptomyces sp. NPDC002566]|uniref:hypothetical protein n=1 Tax=Streptomyces sp. NPDC002566 TaxID=3364650 RepID=UPI00369D630E
MGSEEGERDVLLYAQPQDVGQLAGVLHVLLEELVAVLACPLVGDRLQPFQNRCALGRREVVTAVIRWKLVTDAAEVARRS